MVLRKPTDSLVIKPRLSSSVRLGLVAAIIIAVAGAGLAGYWAGKSEVRARLASGSDRIENLHDELQESRRAKAESEAGFNAAREEMRQEFENSRESMRQEFENARESMRREFADARDRLETELKNARERMEMTRTQLETARSSLTKVTRQLQIDQTAYKELRKELEASNRRITDLASELKFYRSIISPADGRSGVRIQEFELLPADSERAYRYRLILIQALEHDRAVKGAVRFEIRGTSDGASKTIQAPELSQGRITADFKYFQNFAGTFSFPPGFMPAEVKVIFETEDSAVVERVYPWPSLDTDGNA